MGPRPNLPVKVPVTISTMINFNRPNFGVVTCEQAFKVDALDYVFPIYFGCHEFYVLLIFFLYELSGELKTIFVDVFAVDFFLWIVVYVVSHCLLRLWCQLHFKCVVHFHHFFQRICNKFSFVKIANFRI